MHFWIISELRCKIVLGKCVLILTRLQISSYNVQNVVVWGLPTAPIADVSHAHVIDYGGLVGTDQKTPGNTLCSGLVYLSSASHSARLFLHLLFSCHLSPSLIICHERTLVEGKDVLC